MLYNFQDTEGIREKAKSLENEDVESALAELEGAQKLFASGRSIKFIVPSNTKMRDYDLETYLEDGTPVACEMKCKFEITDFSAKTIRKTIKNGASQLPKDKPGVIILKLPEYWVSNENFGDVVDEGIESAFRQTRTVSSVIYFWESWESWEGKGARRTMYQEIRGLCWRSPKQRV